MRYTKYMPSFFAGFVAKERTAPATPSTNDIVVYGGTDHKLHTLDSNGVDRVLARSVAAKIYMQSNFR